MGQNLSKSTQATFGTDEQMVPLVFFDPKKLPQPVQATLKNVPYAALGALIFDEDNDFEMIEYAGKGIAMHNAIPELKSLANDITLSNEKDGIAVYLEENLSL